MAPASREGWRTRARLSAGLFDGANTGKLLVKVAQPAEQVTEAAKAGWASPAAPAGAPGDAARRPQSGSPTAGGERISYRTAAAFPG